MCVRDGSRLRKLEVTDLHEGPNTISSSPQGDTLEKTKMSTSAALGRVTSRFTTRLIIDPGPPPDGGLRAWTQVFCAWLAVTNTWGFVNSFGVFQTYYTEILPQSPSTISWIGSTQACFMFSLGVVSGRALDAGLFLPTVIAGVVLQLVGIFTMSLATNFWQLLLTQGICTGVGGGIFFTPVMGLSSTYFAKKKGMAIGIITTGNSIGGIIYPLIVRQLLGPIGFGWTVRVLGLLNLVSLAVVIAFMKPRLPPRKSGPLVDPDAFRDIPYMLHSVGICFLMPPVYFVFYYIASFARDELAMPYTTSLNMVIILNGVGFPARVIPGFIADRYIGALNTFIICLFFTTVILFSWLGVNSIPSYFTFTVFYGMFSGAFQSLFATTIAAYSSDISKTGTRLGIGFALIGIPALIGGPISGALLKVGGSYNVPIIWAGASTVVGTGFCVAARVVKHGWSWRIRC
ncbi:major facilitator superfamily domain-containing protein [Pyrenochaeta sp. MPI-SDFR-AT-0127]|nr:major facilitator superfamily domain-containing protein [Pyrenochaeta sp. MPI-SDFR-AT-0127]